MRQETLCAADLDEMLALCTTSSTWTYSVAWIDCLARGKALGRGLVYRGEHATLDEYQSIPDRGAPLELPAHRARQMPVDLPGWALNRLSVKAFNALYYWRGKPGIGFPDYETFFLSAGCNPRMEPHLRAGWVCSISMCRAAFRQRQKHARDFGMHRGRGQWLLSGRLEVIWPGGFRISVFPNGGLYARPRFSRDGQYLQSAAAARCHPRRIRRPSLSCQRRSRFGGTAMSGLPQNLQLFGRSVLISIRAAR